jgi:hypothetical protein
MLNSLREQARSHILISVGLKKFSNVLRSWLFWRRIPTGSIGCCIGSHGDRLWVSLQISDRASRPEFSLGVFPFPIWSIAMSTPETDVSPYEPLDSKKLNDAAERALNHYLNPAALKSPARKPSTMYMVAPDIADEDLLAHTCESLAQASVMASDFAGYLEGPQRNTAMAIQQIVMLAELAVNRMLDNINTPKPAPHR